MAGTDIVLLRAIATRLDLHDREELDPDAVTALGEALGLTPAAVEELAEALQAAGLIRIRWGGIVSLTPEGRDRASGDSRPAQGPSWTISVGNIGDGAIFAPGSPGAVMGNNAMGAGAVRLEPGAAAADLAAALQALRAARADVPDGERQQVDELETELAAATQELRQPAPEPSAVQQRLGRAQATIDRIAGTAESVGRLGRALNAIKTVVTGILAGFPG
jgi:hypothetical protein